VQQRFAELMKKIFRSCLDDLEERFYEEPMNIENGAIEVGAK